MKILFSPIGNNDPFGKNNFRDGAMLNIVRNYKPEKVYLFFTDSLWNNTKYSKEEWKKIIKSVNDCEVFFLIEKIDKPNDYDAYKNIFHKVISNIVNENADSEIIINVTSGTPQIGATLCLEYITYPKNLKILQVDPPLDVDLSEVNFNDYSLEKLIECINSLENDKESRVKEINIISFRKAMMKHSLDDLIDNYDYVGAYALAKQLHFNELSKNLETKIEEINCHKIFNEFEKKYKDKDLKRILSQFAILTMRYYQKNYAEVMIRIKSQLEYILLNYLINKGIILQKGNEKKYKYFYNHKELEKLNIHTYKDVLGKIDNYQMMNRVENIFNINDDRNNIVHNLKEFDVDYYKIEKAHESLREIIKDIYKYVDDEDLVFFKKYNEYLRSKYDI